MLSKILENYYNKLKGKFYAYLILNNYDSFFENKIKLRSN